MPRIDVKGLRIEQAVKATLELSLERGFNGWTLSDVAEKVGLAKAALYMYFDGADDIRKQVAKAHLANCLEIGAKVAEKANDEGSPWPEQVCAALLADSEFDEHRGLLLEIQAAAVRSDVLAEMVTDHAKRLKTLVGPFIRDGIKLKAIRAGSNPQMAVEIAFGAQAAGLDVQVAVTEYLAL